MNNRFETLYKLQNNLYAKGCPVVILAGSLLKDNVTGKLVIQMKYQSVSQKAIKALKINIKAIDVTGQEIENVEYQYLDMNVKKGQFFGEDKAIIISNLVARSYKIVAINVVYRDGEIYTYSEEMKMLTEPQLLSSVLHGGEIEKQYRLETNSYAKFAPIICDELWYCTCGTWNIEEHCDNCSLTKESVFNAFNINELRQSSNRRVIEENAKREIQEKERLAKLEEEQKKKLKLNKLKRKVCVIMLVVLCTISMLIVGGVSINNIVKKRNNEKQAKYEQDKCYDLAKQYINEEKFSEAYECIKEYPQYIEEIFFEKADIYYNEKKFNLMIECVYEIYKVDSERVINYIEEKGLGFIDFDTYIIDNSFEDNIIDMFSKYVLHSDYYKAKSTFDFLGEDVIQRKLQECQNGVGADRGLYINILSMYVFDNIEKSVGGEDNKLRIARDIVFRTFGEQINVEWLRDIENKDGNGLIDLPRQIDEYYNEIYHKYKELEGAYMYCHNNSKMYIYISDYKVYWCDTKGKWHKSNLVETDNIGESWNCEVGGLDFRYREIICEGEDLKECVRDEIHIYTRISESDIPDGI